MFLMRRAKAEDVSTLLKLAKMVHFINLPADKDIISDKANWSRQCFLKAARDEKPAPSSTGKGHGPGSNGKHAARAGAASTSDASGLASAVTRSDLFMFVLEDTESKGVLGTSQIISQMGGPGHPNVSFRLSRKEKFSKSLQVGATHTVAKLVLDESGPTEIGGLILQPSYRGHKARLGRFLSLVRFHFVGLHPELFSDRIIAEMMGPLTPDGRNTLWEYLGRRFINLTYPEADSFCQYSKEFMISLLPHEEIYLTLLPPEARSVIAEVGPETLPARKMLEKLGFAYRDHIDVFDGGPMLECATRDISIVRQTSRRVLGEPIEAEEANELVMVSHLDDDGDFRCLNVPGVLVGGSSRTKSAAGAEIRLTRAAMETLHAEVGFELGVTPMGALEETSRASVPASAAANAATSRNGSGTGRKLAVESAVAGPAKKSTSRRRVK